MFQLVKLDEEFLASIGLADLSDDEKKEALDDIKTALEAKVGVKITQNLSDEQVDQFSNLLSGTDHNAALSWIETNIPNYREIVMQELDAIVDQIKHNNLAYVKRL